jgi:hypothetical protein
VPEVACARRRKDGDTPQCDVRERCQEERIEVSSERATDVIEAGIPAVVGFEATASAVGHHAAEHRIERRVVLDEPEVHALYRKERLRTEVVLVESIRCVA